MLKYLRLGSLKIKLILSVKAMRAKNINYLEAAHQGMCFPVVMRVSNPLQHPLSSISNGQHLKREVCDHCYL